MSELIEALLEAGLLLFGAFHGKDRREAYHQLRLDLLPSYPAVLRRAADVMLEKIGRPLPDRLVCTPDAIALATLVSQAAGTPLVVYNGRPGSPAQRFVGAYDVGHPAVLITLTADHPHDMIVRLVDEARSVGLEIDRWISLIQTVRVDNPHHAAALHIEEISQYLVERGELPAALADRVAGR